MSEREDLQRAARDLDIAIQKKKQNRTKEAEDAKIGLLANLPDEIANKLEPFMEALISSTVQSISGMIDRVAELKIEAPNVSVSTPEVIVPKIDVPKAKVDVDVKLPDIKVPTPQVTLNPTFNVPPIKIPTIKVPKADITIEPTPVTFPPFMKVLLDEVDMKHPLPVILVDRRNKAYEAISGGSTGKSIGGAVPKGLNLPEFDNVSLTETSETDDYRFTKSDIGVARVLITYSDESKSTISTVAKS